MHVMRSIRMACLLLAPQILAACHCLVSRSTCHEVSASNLVFIGTVDTIQPAERSTQKVRFKVKTMFRRKTDAESNSPFVDIWNEAGDCSIAFQTGETYLVYATDDEQSDHFETGVCHRTARLSDAGEDLAYLYFLQNGGKETNRLEGFVTSDIQQLHPDRFHYTGAIKSPVANVVVELKSKAWSRYTESDGGGRFVFDGLAEGDYQVSVFELGFPEHTEKLSGPKRIRVRADACTITALPVLIRHPGR